MGMIRQLLGLQEAADKSEANVQEGVFETLTYRLEESLAQLELSRENAGWMRLSEQYAQEFSRDGLTKAAEMGRVFGIANPIIKRGREIRHAYVWGQGVTISARDQDVNTVLQAFIDDEGNREAFYGAQARQQYEGALFDEGNFFLAHFTNPLTGRVKVRSIPFDEVMDVITAPGDKATPWFYLRQWVEVGTDGQNVQMKAYYPALKYQPRMKTIRIDGVPVLWDAPVRHVKVNAGNGWKFGIGDSYAAIPWALSHKGFLEDWALLMKALAKIAFTTSSKSTGVAQAKRAQIQSLGNMQAGSTVSMSDDQKLEAVPKSGATIDSESSRPLATMAASAMGIPVTIVLADPGQTGARATAETLDLPTRLIMQARQELHTEVFRDSIGYAIEQAVIAPQGALRRLGTAVRDEDRLTVEFKDESAATVEVVWPSLDEVDVKVLIDAIVAADGLPDMPKLPLIKLALQALRIRDVDELIDKITDANGDLIVTDTTAGDVAANAFRNGQDPAAALK
ncbi:hypothetical protein ABC337_15250 [Arthrobacter sp. 1P04PC]|uniref:hypothetical protein n=1 Tax=unclassified Arthrobacter TaxID=235627 RepID=UPI00399F8529